MGSSVTTEATVLVASSCTECLAAIEVEADTVRIHRMGAVAVFGMPCPSCGRWSSKPANAHLLAEFAKAKVFPTVIALEQGGRGAPLTEDDLLDFGREIEATAP